MPPRPGAPPDEPPERLFRALLALHPSRPLRHRLRALPSLPLSVRALRAGEILGAVHAGMTYPVEELRGGRVEVELLARCLWTPAGPAFADVDEVGLLAGPEIAALAAEALPALDAVGPTYARSDVEAWRRVLEQGAAHGANLHDAMVLAGCVDDGAHVLAYRPERYWGVAPCDLLDGHRMAFHAARTVLEDLVKKTAKKPTR